jgi:hypothetical protein
MTDDELVQLWLPWQRSKNAQSLAAGDRRKRNVFVIAATLTSGASAPTKLAIALSSPCSLPAVVGAWWKMKSIRATTSELEQAGATVKGNKVTLFRGLSGQAASDARARQPYVPPCGRLQSYSIDRGVALGFARYGPGDGFVFSVDVDDADLILHSQRLSHPDLKAEREVVVLHRQQVVATVVGGKVAPPRVKFTGGAKKPKPVGGTTPPAGA